MRNRRPSIGSIPSPCIKVCRIEKDGYCAGCKRTIDEIREWSIISEDEQKKLLFKLAWRKKEKAHD
jgi:predicted Fe-S protein YdhL (DUF1289 family)